MNGLVGVPESDSFVGHYDASASSATASAQGAILPYVCYTEKATPARHRPERQHNARSNRRKQCSPNETIPYSNPKPPRKRQNTPTNGHTPTPHEADAIVCVSSNTGATSCMCIWGVGCFQSVGQTCHVSNKVWSLARQ